MKVNKKKFPFLMLVHPHKTNIKELMEITTVPNAVQQAETLGLVPEGRFQTTYAFPDALPKLSDEYGRQMMKMLEAQTADQYTGYLIGRYSVNLYQLAQTDLQEQQKQNRANIHLFTLQCKAKLSATEQELERIEKQLTHVQSQLEQLMREEDSEKEI